MWMAAAIVLLSEVMLSSHPQPPARDLPASRQSGTATLRGRVVTADSGEPLRNARVALGGISNIQPVFTANDGRFTFAGLPAGHYIVSARKAGYAPTTFGQRRPDLPPIPIDLEAGDVFQDAELRMPRSAAISGRIIDEFGDPLELATVVASRIVRKESFTVSVAAATAVTDDLGEDRPDGRLRGNAGPRTWRLVDLRAVARGRRRHRACLHRLGRHLDHHAARQRRPRHGADRQRDRIAPARYAIHRRRIRRPLIAGRIDCALVGAGERLCSIRVDRAARAASNPRAASRCGRMVRDCRLARRP